MKLENCNLFTYQTNKQADNIISRQVALIIEYGIHMVNIKLAFIKLARCSVAVSYMTAYRHTRQAQHSMQAQHTGKQYRHIKQAKNTGTSNCDGRTGTPHHVSAAYSTAYGHIK